MSGADQTHQNSKDIAALTNTVTRIATLVESSEKRHDSAMLAIKELGEKVSATANMKDEICGMREDLRIVRHDLNTVNNGLTGIVVLGEKLAEHKSDTLEKITDLKTILALNSGRIKTIEDRNTRIDGAARVVEKISGWVWVGIGAIATLAASNWTAIKSALIGGGISGE